jgi:hypothetical protein
MSISRAARGIVAPLGGACEMYCFVKMFRHSRLRAVSTLVWQVVRRDSSRGQQQHEFSPKGATHQGPGGCRSGRLSRNGTRHQWWTLP